MLKRIPIEQVVPNPNQPRKFFDEQKLRELASSIRENGLMQPIVVRPAGDKFMVVAGERRFRAHQLLNAKSILCQVRELTDDEVALQAIVENLQRADVKPLEEARAFKVLLDSGMTEGQIARKVGCLEFRIREKVNLMLLDEQLQKLVDANQLSVTAGYEIARLPHREQIKLAQKLSGGTIKYPSRRTRQRRARPR